MSEVIDGTSEETNIWLEENKLDFALQTLRTLKTEREKFGGALNELFQMADPDAPDNQIKIIGNPTLGEVESIMIGVRNKKDDGLNRCVEVWVNELRLTGFDERGGFAGLARLDVQLADVGQVTASGSYQSIGFGSIDQKVNERSREENFQYDFSGSLKLDKFFPEEWKLNIPFYAQYSQEISTPEYDPYQLDVPLEERLAGIVDLRQRDSVRQAARTIRTISSFNFTDVKKNRTSKLPPLPIDISNFSFTYAQSRNLFQSPLIAREERTEHRGVIDYKYSPGIKPIYPFKKAMSKIKNKKTKNLLKLISDFNFNPLPNSIGFRNELRRDFGETQYRFTDEATSTFYDKKFSWIRSYNLVWNFTKSLRFNYTATNDGVIDEPEGRINDQVKRDSLWKNVLRFGRTKNYQHNIGLSYNLPFSKIPALDWITVKAQYNATYSWTAAALNLDSLGNTIQNSQKRQLTGDFQFTKLYNKSKFLKKINTPKRPNAKKPEKPKFPEKPVFPKPLSEIEDKEEREKEKEKRKAELKKWRGEMAKVRAKIEPSDGARAVLRPLMFLQRARLTYNEDFSTVLPGFMGMSRYLGQDVTFTQPGVDFIIGLQPDQSWLDRAAQRGMITDNIFLNGQVLQTHNTNYTAKVTLEPVRGFKIDLDLNKNITENYSELFKVEDAISGTFEHLTPMRMGSVKMSYLPIGSFFDQQGTKGANSSVNFETFEKNRVIISNRLGQGVHADSINRELGYTEGFGRYQQDVLIPSFLAAYNNVDVNTIDVNKDVRDLIPMPNWKVTYNGLAKIKGLDKIFKSFSLTHGYRSSLSVNSFATDLDFQEDPSQTDINSDNFYSTFEIPTLIITEAFNPLIGLDMRFKNDLSLRFNYKSSRNLSMSFIDYQLSEQNTTDVTIGFGWRFKNFKFKNIKNILKSKKKREEDKEKEKIKSKTQVGGMDFNFSFGKTIAKDELNLKFDFSYRDDRTVNHILDQDQSVATRGMRTIRIAPSIEWIPNNRLTFRLFVDYTQTIPAVSTSFPITNVKGGLTIRFSLSQ